MQYTELITNAAYRSTAEDVQQLRDHGWTEDQISEAVFIIAMFAFFNRVADAFGVSPQNYLALDKNDAIAAVFLPIILILLVFLDYCACLINKIGLSP